MCGSLVAPSFGLIERTKNPIGTDVTNYKEDYKALKTILQVKGKIEEGFTLIDVVDATCKLFSYISLVKLIRFKRGDETIIYSENVLGERSSAQVSRVDPVELFQNKVIKEADGNRLLLENGVVPELAQCCISHAQYNGIDCSIEELLVALSDSLWKGTRVERLEL